MPGYVVAAVFDVPAGAARTGRDVLVPGWGPGHRLSFCDGRTLTLVVEVSAPARGDAFDAVLDRAERVWGEVGGGPLPPPTTLSVQPVVPEARLLPGPVGRGPDCVMADASARVAARLRATRAALAALDDHPLDVP